MTVDELLAARDRRPFRPFVIRTADGGETEVSHPEAIGWDCLDGPIPMIRCTTPYGAKVFIAARAIVSLSFPD